MTIPDSLLGAAATTENPKKILFGKYELGRLLGCGAFAKVYHARTLPGSNNNNSTTTSTTNTSFSSSSVAIKVINKSRLAKPGLPKSSIRREVAILRRVRHPHIVRLVEVLASRTKIFFVLEFAKGGELFGRLSRTGRLSEELSRRLFRQLISAVAYCHSRGVFHRDLKPENLLLDEHNNLKVTDFGLSALSSDASRPPSQEVLHTLCGTPAYVAPEILSKKGYDGAKVDVWSCGVILFVLNAGYLPFNDCNLMNMYKKIYRGEYRIPKWTSPELRRLLSGILDTNPDTRMSVDEISRDPWFRKGMGDEEWEALMSFHEPEKDELDEELEEEEGLDHNRELNAFDLISFSSGVNLSGLFEPGDPSKERFLSTEPGEGILGTVEEVGRKEGLYVRRRGKRGRAVVVEGHNGNFGVGVRVYRLNQEMVVVEVDVGGESWAKELWREKMGPAIKKPITTT